MRRIRTRTIALFILLSCLQAGLSQTVDCIVAEVNGKAMTLTDVRILKDFAIIPEGRGAVPPETLRQALEEAIDRRVVIDLVRGDIEVTQEEAEDVLARCKYRFEAGQWQEKLERYGLQEKGLRPYIDDLIRYIKTIDLRFGRGKEINPQEVERYYEDVYIPSERALGRAPKSLPQAQAEIEALIRSQESREQSAAWVRSLRGQAEVRINESCLEQAN